MSGEGKVTDLMAALEQSLADAKKARAESQGSAKLGSDSALAEPPTCQHVYDGIAGICRYCGHHEFTTDRAEPPKPRRMQPMAGCSPFGHGDEHDWMPGCDKPPPCVPVEEGAERG